MAVPSLSVLIAFFVLAQAAYLVAWVLGVDIPISLLFLPSIPLVPIAAAAAMDFVDRSGRSSKV